MPEAPIKTALKVTNLSKVYKGGFKALNSVDLEIQAGDFFGLLGPNGAGKTSLISIVTSVATKTTGNISVNGFDLNTQLNLAKLGIGVVPQEFNFNIFEPAENVILNQAGFYGVKRRLAKQRCEKYLKKLGLWEKRKASVRALSGGMKRRLMIARALIHHPKLLILDEPTAGVDIESRRDMWQFLQELNESGTTILLTTHYLEEAEALCKNIAIINNGEIIENGNTHELLRKLQVETFIMDLANPLKNLPNLEPFTVRQITDDSIEIDISKQYTLNDCFNLLSKHSIEVSSMKNKSSRLEELFLKLVREDD